MAKRNGAELAKVVEKRRWSELEARVVVGAWRRSGQGMSEFARANGLKAQRVHRWSVRLEGESGRGVRFHPVRVVGGDGEAIEIVLLNGRRVRVPAGFSSEELSRVVEIVDGVS